MARENINPNPSQRLLEVYTDFSGGNNSEISNEKLKDNEFPIFDNVDLSGRGSSRRRYGRINGLTSYPSGNGQGVFYYFPGGASNPNIVMAVGGLLYLRPYTPTQITAETPTGAVNGVNKVFTLANKWNARGTVSFKIGGVAQTFLETPVVAPFISAVNGVADMTINNMPTGTYYVGYTLTNATGETQISPLVNVTLLANQQIAFQAPTLPSGATGYNIYVSTATDSQTVGKFNSSPLTASTNIRFPPASTAAAPPTSNTATMYTVDYANGVVTMVTAPTTGSVVTCDYQYELSSLPITGLGGGFQTTLPIEAVEYKGKLYIATGTQLVQYDGTTASTVTPYTPTVLEAIYVGTNALMSNPNAYVTDGTQGSGISVAGISPSARAGAANQAITFTGYSNKASGITAVDYLWEYKKSTDTTWTTGLNWAGNTSGANKTWTFTPAEPVNYDIRLTVRDANVTTTVSTPYLLTQFPISQQAPTALLPSSTINSCTKIIVHWDRLILSKDNTNSFQIYISDLTNPAYFPTTNTISFDNGKQEPITAIVRFKAYLFVFTKTTIWSLQGKGPSTYDRNLVHDVYGCIADRTVQVVRNQVVFLSSEGIMELRPNLYFTTFDVHRIDLQIRSAVPQDTSACAVVYDNMYWICFPGSSIGYRMYIDLGGAWVRDKSSKLNIVQFAKYGSDIYNLTTDGKLWKHSKTAYDDAGEVYTMTVSSKFLDFASHLNYKKMKRIFVLAKHFSDHNVDIGVTVQADSAIILTPDASHAYISGATAYWLTTTAPNMHYYSGTALGQWILGTSPLGNVTLSVQRASISGKGRRVQVTFAHTEPNACEIYGFGIEFRLKRP